MDESCGTTVYSPALWTRAKDKEIGEKLQRMARKAEVFCRSFSYTRGASGPDDALGGNDRWRTDDGFMKVSQSCALLLDCISARFCRTLAILAKNFRGALRGGAESYFAYRAGTGTVQLQSVTDVVPRNEVQVWKESSGFGSRKFPAMPGCVLTAPFPCCRIQTPGDAGRSCFQALTGR
jgi:hypothetical protein